VECDFHPRVNESDLPRQPPEESSSRSLLWGKKADTSAASDLMNLVVDVDDVEARRARTGARKLEGMAHAQMDLVIARRVIAAGNDPTLVIQEDAVARDIAELLLNEIGLKSKPTVPSQTTRSLSKAAPPFSSDQSLRKRLCRNGLNRGRGIFWLARL
jgi:hypothetical protein